MIPLLNYTKRVAPFSVTDSITDRCKSIPSYTNVNLITISGIRGPRRDSTPKLLHLSLRSSLALIPVALIAVLVMYLCFVVEYTSCRPIIIFVCAD